MPDDSTVNIAALRYLTELLKADCDDPILKSAWRREAERLLAVVNERGVGPLMVVFNGQRRTWDDVDDVIQSAARHLGVTLNTGE